MFLRGGGMAVEKQNGENKPAIELVDELIAERRGEGALPDDMPRWMARAIHLIDSFSRRAGAAVCWLTLPIFLTMVYEIFVRYAFTAPTLWAYDISRMLYGAMFMLGAGYALMRGVHIRADFLYRNFSPRAQGVVDSALYLCLFFPAMIIFLFFSSEYAFDAWRRGERLDDSAWRPLVAPARTAMPLGAALLVLQGISETLKSFYAAWRGRWP